MFCSGLRPLFPQTNPSMCQRPWFPASELDELQELERLEKKLESENDVIANTMVPNPIGTTAASRAAAAAQAAAASAEDEAGQGEVSCRAQALARSND